jgi:hypothetical protein
MHMIKKNLFTGAALCCAMLALAGTLVWADETVAQAPPAPPPAAGAPAAPPPAAGAPAAPGTPPAAPAPAPAPTSPLIGPALAGSLTIQLPPPKLSVPLLGTVYLDGIGSGLGQWQNNPFPGNRAWQPDLSNGQLFLQKTDGVFQFYAQFGAYSIAALGAPYVSAATATFGAGGLPATGDLLGLVSDGVRQDRAY